MHEHTWRLFSVLSQPKRPVTPDHVIVQAKLHYRCDPCGETKEELYEGPPDGMPELPITEGMRALHERTADPEHTIQP